MADITKIWTRDEIDALLRSNSRAVEKAIVKLFELQTKSEQVRGDTNESNQRGFSMTDALVGTRFAEWISGKDRKGVSRWAPKSLNHPGADRIFRRYLKKHPSAMARALDIALRHSRQLVDIANGDLKIEG